MQTLLQGIKKPRPPPSSSLTILPHSSWCGSGNGGPTGAGQAPSEECGQRAGHLLWPQPSCGAAPGPHPQPWFQAQGSGTESQSCCNIKQTWQREPAACGTPPLPAIFSCFSRETRLMQPACKCKGSSYCSPWHLHLLDGTVAPAWV